MAVHGGPDIVTDSLVLSLDAGDPASYPGSGTTWTDLSGNGNNGTLSAAAIGTDIPGVMDFNGSDEYISCNRAVEDDFTLDIWFYPTANGDANFGPTVYWYGGSGLMDCETGGQTDDFGLVWYSNTIAFGVGNPDTTYQSSALSLNVWHNVICTRTKSSGVLAIYINGISDGGGAHTNTASLDAMSTMYIGNDSGTRGYLTGNIAICRAYNKVLTQNEISQNFNAHRSRFGL